MTFITLTLRFWLRFWLYYPLNWQSELGNWIKEHSSINQQFEIRTFLEQFEPQIAIEIRTLGLRKKNHVLIKRNDCMRRLLFALQWLSGDCNFHCNRWRRHLEAAETESAKLTRECNLRKNIISQLTSEARTVKGRHNQNL